MVDFGVDFVLLVLTIWEKFFFPILGLGVQAEGKTRYEVRLK